MKRIAAKEKRRASYVKEKLERDQDTISRHNKSWAKNQARKDRRRAEQDRREE